MKKRRIVLTTLIMVAVFLVPTAVFAGGGQEVPEEEAGVPGELMEPENPVTLTMWMQDWPEAQAIFEQFHAKLKEEHPNIDVEMSFIPWSELGSKMIPSVMSGTEPDVMFGYHDWLTGHAVENLFLQLTPHIEDIDTIKSDYLYETFLPAVSGEDGELYAIPLRGASEGGGAIVNARMAEEAGVDVGDIEEFEDVYEAAKALTQYNDDGSIRVSGFDLDNYWALTQWYLDNVRTLGGDIYDPETNDWDMTVPEAVEAMEMFKRFVDEEIWDPSSGSALDAYPKELSAAYHIGIWMLATYAQNYPDLENDYFIMPAVDPDNRVYGTPSTIIVSFSKRLSGDKKRAALIYARELMQPSFFEIYNQYSWGLITSIPWTEGYRNGEYDDTYGEWERFNIDLAMEKSEYLVPYIDDIPTALGYNTLSTVFTPEFQAVFANGKDIPTALEDLTKALNQAEKEARL